ncbi:unnamed protein product [Echinostoma caproni]|uniref:DUF7041 domain-containing protein n=1 Tax=Echinostoma caproni TaxID=27848 RepID=A0A183B176_9TREM|nr:unnamed protein product [Echinostoma caproni]
MLKLPDMHHREVQPTPADPYVGLGVAGVANEGLGAEPEELPAFSINNFRLWFARTKAHFHTHPIRSRTIVYSQIFTALPTDIAEQVFEFIITIPKNEPFTQLKEALITRKSSSDEHRLDKLFGDLELGDCTPS